jgi:hypothetical protein
MDLDRVRDLAGQVAEALEDPARAEEVERLLARATASGALQPRPRFDQRNARIDRGKAKRADARPAAKTTRKK